jgi:hypothetical protein
MEGSKGGNEISLTESLLCEGLGVSWKSNPKNPSPPSKKTLLLPKPSSSAAADRLTLSSLSLRNPCLRNPLYSADRLTLTSPSLRNPCLRNPLYSADRPIALTSKKTYRSPSLLCFVLFILILFSILIYSDFIDRRGRGLERIEVYLDIFPLNYLARTSLSWIIINEKW